MTVRIAMWSGPRNISTAMMRAFENRPDTAVSDEPFYAAYLAGTGLDHPMRAEVLASQPTDWRVVADAMAGAAPGDAPVWYQKHMTHHMLPGFGMAWAGACRSAFLIRAPEAVLASYTVKREQVTLDDIGFVQQRELFEREADRLGAAPPVVEGRDVLVDPRGDAGQAVRGAGHRLRRRDARLAGGSTGQRRRLGAGLVRRGRGLHRIWPAPARSRPRRSER
jgi:hypothetical protein